MSLLGQCFKVVTDCGVLGSAFSKRDILPRVAGWWMLMREFDCAVEYRAGAGMTRVDALSCDPIANGGASRILERCPSVRIVGGEDWLHTLRIGGVGLCGVRDVLAVDLGADQLKCTGDGFLIKDSKLYGCLDYFRPKQYSMAALWHQPRWHWSPGVEMTLDVIEGSCWFERMAGFVGGCVCMECNCSGRRNATDEERLHPMERVEVPFHNVHVDRLGPFFEFGRGGGQLLVVVNGSAKYAFAEPVRDASGEYAVEVLDDIFIRLESPIVLVMGEHVSRHMGFGRFCASRREACSECCGHPTI